MFWTADTLKVFFEARISVLRNQPFLLHFYLHSTRTEQIAFYLYFCSFVQYTTNIMRAIMIKLFTDLWFHCSYYYKPLASFGSSVFAET